MFLFLAFFVFFLGLAVGSFLNAVIYRLEKGESALRGRSYCPHCKHQLAWRDLVPLVSFFLLRGKCRYCEVKISWQYPIVEISTALIFLLIFNFQFSISNEFSNFLIPQTVYLFTIASLLVILFVYDLKYYILPDKILFPAIGIVFLYQVFVFFIQNLDLIKNSKLEIKNLETLTNPFFAGAFAAGFFLAIFLVSRGHWMGFGDVKLAFFMGLFLGWPDIFASLVVAFFVGAIIGLGLMVLRKKDLKSEIPFGPFLVMGTFAALFWGKELVDWYTGLFLV